MTNKIKEGEGEIRRREWFRLKLFDVVSKRSLKPAIRFKPLA